MKAVAAVDRRADRRAARQAAGRADILDAAETVFAEHGFRSGSVRMIAAEAGFSTGAVYLFFDSKEQLVAETFRRRGDELVEALRAAARDARSPLGALHDVVDVTADFFVRHAGFARLLRRLEGGPVLIGSALDGLDQSSAGFREASDVLAAMVRDGQALGEIREGAAGALARVFAVLVNDYVLLSAGVDHTALTRDQLHGVVDGALRRPGTSS